MKRNFSAWLGLCATGLLVLALAPAFAQAPAAAPAAEATGKLHGRVINPTGQPQGGGNVSLSTDGGVTLKYTFPVSETGEFTGEDLAQDDDMSRQEYIDKMSPDEKKQLEDLRKANADAMKANVLINQLNAD